MKGSIFLGDSPEVEQKCLPVMLRRKQRLEILLTSIALKNTMSGSFGKTLVDVRQLQTTTEERLGKKSFKERTFIQSSKVYFPQLSEAFSCELSSSFIGLAFFKI